MLIGCDLYRRSIKQQGLGSLDGDELYARLRRNFNRLATDHRYVKPIILVWLRHFDHHRNSLSKGSTSSNRLIRSFKRFDRQNGLVTNYNRLTDIQSTDLHGNRKAIFRVVQQAALRFRYIQPASTIQRSVK